MGGRDPTRAPQRKVGNVGWDKRSPGPPFNSVSWRVARHLPFLLGVAQPVQHSRPRLCVATGPYAPGCAWSLNRIGVAADTAEAGCATRPTRPMNSAARNTGLLYTIPARKASGKTSHLRGFPKKGGERGGEGCGGWGDVRPEGNIPPRTRVSQEADMHPGYATMSGASARPPARPAERVRPIREQNSRKAYRDRLVDSRRSTAEDADGPCSNRPIRRND
jgi:hypothetical protein